MHKSQEKEEAAVPNVIILETPAPASKEDAVGVKSVQTPTPNGLAPPPQGDGALTPMARSHGRAGGNTIQRGDFDQAIRGMMDGTQRRRRENLYRPLSRIFVDGSRQSRAIE